MRRILLRSSAFVRAAKRLAKRQPAVVPQLQLSLELLAEDAFDPRLRTHRLKGDLSNSCACSVAYDIRIVFKFVKDDGEDAILLQTIGTHDEVY